MARAGGQSQGFLPEPAPHLAPGLYCHCAAGINRGPSTAYAILIALGLRHHEARAMIVTHRPQTIVGMRYADDAERAITALGYV